MFHVARDGHEYGPYSAEEIKQHLAGGTLLPSDYLREETEQEWVTIGHTFPAHESAKPAGAPANPSTLSANLDPIDNIPAASAKTEPLRVSFSSEPTAPPSAKAIASASHMAHESGHLPLARARKPRANWLPALVAAILLLAAAIAVCWLFFRPATIALRLEGSTTIGDELAPRLLVAFLKSEGASDIEELPQKVKGHHDVRAKLHGHWFPEVFSVLANGSGNAFTALRDGKADIGMASRPINDKEVAQLANLGDMRSPACESIIALDGLAIVVNRNNYVAALTRQQLASIFSGQAGDWSQFGGPREPIHLYGRTAGGTYDTFAALVLTDEKGHKTPFAAGIQAEDNGEAIAAAVAADPDGIGYVGIAQTTGVKALPLSASPASASLMPYAFTVATEDYILSRRLFLYTPAKPTDLARDFVAFALSADGQKVVEDVGFVQQTPHFEEFPIPDNAPPLYRKTVSGLRRMDLNFRFLSNGTSLDNKALADIRRTLAAFKENNIRSAEVLGFADSKGDPRRNQELSEQRAAVVAAELSKYGIDARVAGFSYAMPVGDNATQEGRDKNRRVEVWAK